MTYSELQSDARHLTQTDSSNWSDDDLNRSLNEWQYKVATKMWQASSEWEWNDTSRDKKSEAYTDLVEGQSGYRMPNEVFRIDRVEVTNDEGDDRLLTQITKEDVDIALTEFREDNGMPQYYDLRDDLLLLFPAPDSDEVTLTKGLNIYVARQPQEFETSDSREPGFPRQFHRILSLGAALDYCIANNLENKEVEIRRMLYGDQTVTGAMEELKESIGTRELNKKTSFSPAFKNTSYE